VEDVWGGPYEAYRLNFTDPDGTWYSYVFPGIGVVRGDEFDEDPPHTLLIEPKAEIKKRLGRSPDRADAYVNGLWALQFVEGTLVGGKDAYADEYEDEPYGGNYSAMGM